MISSSHSERRSTGILPVGSEHGRDAHATQSTVIRDRSSAAWLAVGHAQEARGQLNAALDAYEHALVATPGDSRDQALAWMNRGNAFQKIASDAAHETERSATVAAAVSSYDAAIALFRTLPCETVPAYRNHLGAAWLNRGHALLQSDDREASAASFTAAIAHLELLPLDGPDAYRLNLAGAHTNLAHTLLDSAPARARAAARAALATFANVEREHAAFALMSLRARRALVMALGELLTRRNPDQATHASLLAEATDAIDDGLALFRHWESRGFVEGRPLVLRLFRLGAQLYRTHQPHFLAEFIEENISVAAVAADAGFQAAAREAVAQALAELHEPQLLVAGAPDSTRLLETARALRSTQTRLLSFHP